MRAGFAEIDITPPVGTHKIGWLKVIVSESVVDPLFARAAVLEGDPGKIGIIQVDTLSIRWTQVKDIRSRIEAACGFPGACIMVAATHNHAGPAVSATGMVERDDIYIEHLTKQCVEVFLAAIDRAAEAELGFGHTTNFEVAKNRRVVQRDGTVRTHGTFNAPDALFLEGPIDPEVAVFAVRGRNDSPLGCIVNYGCHPTHYGGGTELSAGYPGVLSRDLKARRWPITLFLNGPSGNVHTTNPVDGVEMTMEEAGGNLAGSVVKIVEQVNFSSRWRFGSRSKTVELDYRDISDDEAKGTIRGAQRFVDPTIYDTLMPRLIERIALRKKQPAEVQVLSLKGDTDALPVSIAIAGIPAEYFVEYGLRIKECTVSNCHALISAHTNGMIGYVPTPEAFARGGYETTLSLSSRMAPDTGGILADTALDLING